MREKGFFSPVFTVFSIAFLVGSCVTVNIYFPAAAVEKAADRIVEETWGGESDVDGGGDKGPQSFRSTGRPLFSFRGGPAPAYAQGVDINVTTPAIRSLKEAIRQRSATLRPFLDRGAVGIGLDGLLKVRSTDGLNLKEKGLAGRLVEKENADREALYREIASANNFGPERIPDIKNIFARSWIKKAATGWWIQDPQGQWVKKAPR